MITESKESEAQRRRWLTKSSAGNSQFVDFISSIYQSVIRLPGGTRKTMHQVANRYRYSHSITNGTLTGRKTRVACLLANILDCEILAEKLAGHQGIEVLTATSDGEFGLTRCKSLSPQLLILDPKVASDIVQRAAEMIRHREVEHLLLLDDRLHEGRLSAVLRLPSVSYFTRQAGINALLTAIVQISQTGERAFDPAVKQRIYLVSGVLRLEQPTNRPSVGSLTTRELQVMKLLADGHSVRRCAERLDLAESTIDNHKSRLMKKLDIHKIVELTHFAIREGLIVV